jgi:hypothetical protein
MPEILTKSFNSDTTRSFIDTLVTDEYYLFVSSINEFSPSDTLFSKNQFLEKTLFGKKILTEDIHFMIKYYPWQVGTVYTEYDDRVNLAGTNFYAVVGPNDNDTGDYRVFKCLRNNNNSGVSSPPNYNPTNTSQIYETADGYVWKYMYVLTDLEFEAYNSNGYIPILGTFDTNPAPGAGSSVSDILIENPDDNFGYVVETGSLIDSPDIDGTMSIDPDGSWSQVTNYYADQYVYTTNTNGVSRLFVLEYYFYNENTGNIEIRVGRELLTGAANPVAAGVTTNASVKVFPRVEIKGDGSSTVSNDLDAVAIPNVVNGRIVSLDLLEGGQGYHNVSARVVDPIEDFDPDSSTTTDIRAEIRAVLSPAGGHGYNLIDEFQCRNFSLYAYITADDNTQIGDTNTYGAVGLVKNPEFAGSSPDIFDNRIAITTNDIGNVTLNSTIIQVNDDNEIVFSGIVHEVDLDNSTFYIAEYMGPYKNNPSSGEGDTSLDLTLPFRNETGQTITINAPAASNVTFSEYIQRSGRVYFMENFFPLPRTDLSREEFKFVLEY